MGVLHSIWSDPYSRIDSPIRRLPAGVKFGAALFIVLFAVLTPVHGLAPVLIFPLLTLMLVAITGLSMIPALRLCKKIVSLELVVMGSALLALFQPDGGRIFLWLALRGFICLWATSLLATTTPFEHLLDVMRKLRLPHILITTMAMMYRYFALLVDQSHRIRRARASRTFSATRLSRWHDHAVIVGQLFIRTSERAERVYWAMCARGWK